MAIARSRLVRALGTVWLLAPVVATADSRMEKTFDFEPGASFRLETDAGSISVVGTSGHKAEVVITSRRSDIEDRYNFSFDDSGTGLEIRVKKSEGWSWRSESGGMHFEVRLPPRAEVFVDTAGGRIDLEAIEGAIDLQTSGGDIRIDEVRGDVKADTSGGDIEVTSVEGNVNADTSGGSISIRDVSGEALADTSGGRISMQSIAGDVIAESSGGGIDIDGAGGHVEADTSGGSVTVKFASGNNSGGTLSSSGGPVTAIIDPAVSLDIDASASGGGVKTDVPLTIRGKVSKSKLRGTLNGGGELLVLRSSGGGVSIEGS